MKIRDYHHLLRLYRSWKLDIPPPLWRKHPAFAGDYMATVSTRGRFLYVNVPKAAHTSIKHGITEFEHKRRMSERGVHSHWLNYHITLESAEKFNGYRFSVVRHPLKRMISCYRDKLLYEHENHGRTIGQHGEFPAEMSFRDFLEKVAETPDTEANSHFRSQANYLENSDGVLRADFIGKVESLDEDWQKIMRETGLPPLRRLNPTPDHIFKPEPDPALEKIVLKRFARDYELFGYEPLWP